MSNNTGMFRAMLDLKPFLRLYRQHLSALLVGLLLAVVTLASSIGLLALSGWFISATAIAGLSVATATVFNFFTPGAGVRGFSIARTAGRYFERLISHNTTFRLLATLRVWFYSCVVPMAPAGLAKFRQADLMNRMVADIDALDTLYLRLLSPFICAVVVAIGLIGLAAVFDAGIAVLLGMVMLPSTLLLPFIFAQLGAQPGQQATDSAGVLRTRLHDHIAGQAELQVFGAVEQSRLLLAQSETDHDRSLLALSGVSALAIAIVTMVSGMTLTTILWLGAGSVQTGLLAGPVLVMLALATLAGFEAINPLPAAFMLFGRVQRSASRLNEVANSQPVVVFGKGYSEDAAVEQGAAGEIMIRNISFRYPDTKECVLNDFNLDVKAREHVALMGPTGCGKSTLLQLLTRSYDVSAGEIIIGNQVVSGYSEESLRRHMSVMPQRVHIFSAPLADNLRLANPDATDQQLLDVLEKVGLLHLATSHTDLLQLFLGAGGVSLSGGEQRRLGLARVLLRDSPLVLLDEPTEGLDPVTEQDILQQITEHCRDKTLLVVTHRTAVLKLVDRIVRL